MVISSINNSFIKEIVRLKEKKYRDLTNSFIVEGEHLVLEAYKKGLIKELILEENITSDLNVKTTYVTKSVMKKLSSLDSPCNILAIVNKKNSNDLGDKIIILDNIQDPGNLGTIIRSACAFEIDSIILSKNTVDLYNDKVIRSTQGMLFEMSVLIKDLDTFIPELKKNDYMILGTNVNNGKSLKELELGEKFAIIIGNEGQGIENSISTLCDNNIYIKMSDNCESLNAGVAASIIMYEVFNK